MSQRRTFVDINISAIPVEGWGGLGLLGVAAVTAITLPELRLPVLVGIGGGAALAIILVAFGRIASSARRNGEPPSILFRPAAGTGGDRLGRHDRIGEGEIERPNRLVLDGSLNPSYPRISSLPTSRLATMEDSYAAIR